MLLELTRKSTKDRLALEAGWAVLFCELQQALLSSSILQEQAPELIGTYLLDQLDWWTNLCLKVVVKFPIEKRLEHFRQHLLNLERHFDISECRL